MLRIKKYSYRYPNIVYGYQQTHFGDSWALLNFLLRISEETGRPTKINLSHYRIGDNFRLIRPFLKSRGRIQVVGDNPQRMLDVCEPYGVKFVPTIRRWNPDCRFKSKIIAYQFDGVHLSDQKNLSPGQFSFLMNQLKRMGYKPVDVGHHKPISAIVNTLANCRFFVGCPSGLAVVARSVRCPIYLITNALDDGTVYWLRNCQYPKIHTFGNAIGFLNFIKKRQIKVL